MIAFSLLTELITSFFPICAFNVSHLTDPNIAYTGGFSPSPPLLEALPQTPAKGSLCKPLREGGKDLRKMKVLDKLHGSLNDLKCLREN